MRRSIGVTAACLALAVALTAVIERPRRGRGHAAMVVVMSLLLVACVGAAAMVLSYGFGWPTWGVWAAALPTGVGVFAASVRLAEHG